MKGFGRLLGNELLKIWKQTALRVLIFVLIGFSLVVPVVNALLNSALDGLLGGGFGGTYTAYEEKEWALEDAEREYSRWSDDEEDEEKEKEYYTYWKMNRYASASRAEACDFFINNGMADTWQWEYFKYDYFFLREYKYFCDLIKQGKVTLEEVKMGEGDDFDPDHDWSLDIAELEHKILTADPQIIVSDTREFVRATLDAQKLKIDEAKKKYELDVSDPVLKYDYDAAVAEYAVGEKILNVYNKLVDDYVSPEDWKYLLANSSLTSAVNEYAEYAVEMPFGAYENSYTVYYDSYEAYLADRESKCNYYKSAIDTYIYAIENDIPIPGTGNNATKSAVRSGISDFASIFLIFMIVVVATSITNEFSSGTVRLLLIRPRSRRQIVASKLTAAVIVYFAVLAVVTVLVNVECMMLFGVTDLFVDDLFTIGGAVVRIPAVLNFVRLLALYSLPVLFFMSVAAFFACISKKGVLAIILPLAIFFIAASLSAIVQVVLSFLPQFAPIFAYSPLGYLDTLVVPTPAEELSSMLSAGSGYYAYGFRSWIGAIYYVLFTGVMTYFSVFAYRKMQVKS